MFMRISEGLKIKAFTLLEITIALVLSFFILVILYLSYNIMERQFQNEYQKQLSSLVQLKSKMEMEFFLSDSILFNMNDQISIFTIGKESIYHFSQDAILEKTNLLTDSLYKGECQTIVETMSTKNHVRRLTFNLKVDEDEIQLSFNKFYYPNHIIKNKEIDFEY